MSMDKLGTNVISKQSYKDDEDYDVESDVVLVWIFTLKMFT